MSLLWLDLTVASYSVLLTCHPSPAVSSPAQCGCGWYFYCCGHRARLFPGSAICPPSGHWRPLPAHTIQGHIPALLKGSVVRAHVCALARLCQPPARPPASDSLSECLSGKRLVWLPCYLSTGLPVQCPGAWSLAAPSLRPEWQCHAFAGPLIHSAPTCWASAVCHSALSLRSSESTGKQRQKATII